MKFLTSRMNRATYWTCLGIVGAWALFARFILAKDSGYISEVILAMICVPRMHDVGKSGWIVAVILAAYVATAFCLILNLDVDTALIILGLIILGLTCLLVWLGAIPGQSGANPWGEKPEPGIQLGKPKPKASEVEWKSWRAKSES